MLNRKGDSRQTIAQKSERNLPQLYSFLAQTEGQPEIPISMGSLSASDSSGALKDENKYIRETLGTFYCR